MRRTARLRPRRAGVRPGRPTGPGRRHRSRGGGPRSSSGRRGAVPLPATPGRGSSPPAPPSRRPRRTAVTQRSTTPPGDRGRRQRARTRPAYPSGGRRCGRRPPGWSAVWHPTAVSARVRPPLPTTGTRGRRRSGRTTPMPHVTLDVRPRRPAASTSRSPVARRPRSPAPRSPASGRAVRYAARGQAPRKPAPPIAASRRRQAVSARQPGSGLPVHLVDGTPTGTLVPGVRLPRGSAQLGTQGVRHPPNPAVMSSPADGPQVPGA